MSIEYCLGRLVVVTAQLYTLSFRMQQKNGYNDVFYKRIIEFRGELVEIHSLLERELLHPIID